MTVRKIDGGRSWSRIYRGVHITAYSSHTSCSPWFGHFLFDGKMVFVPSGYTRIADLEAVAKVIIRRLQDERHNSDESLRRGRSTRSS